MKKRKFISIVLCAFLLGSLPSCSEQISPEKEETPQTDQPEKPDPDQPQQPEKPDQPIAPDPEQPQQPDPDQPIAPDPDQPEKPEPQQPEKPEPQQPEKPDPDTPEGENPLSGKSTYVAYEFTAQACAHCPDMGRAMLSQREHFKGNFLVVFLHPRESDSPQLYREEAHAYQQYLIEQKTIHDGFPNFTYNSLGSYREQKTPDDYIDDPSLLALHLAIQRNGNSITLNFKSEVCKGQTPRMEGKEYILMMWLTENDVLEFQYDFGAPGGYDWHFNHSYLFRKALNGLWGEDYVPGHDYSCTATIPENVNADKSQIVVMVLDKKTHATVAAGEYPLGN